MNTLTIRRLSKRVGAEIIGVDRDTLLDDETLPDHILELLEEHGVLVFRDLHLDAQTQVAFARTLGDIDTSPGHHAVEGIYRVSLDTAKNTSASYLRATFDWHIDGCTADGDIHPQHATILSAHAVAARGGETEFASTYDAYDALGDDEKTDLLGLRVIHSLEASQRLVTPDPTPEQLAVWRARPPKVHPLVWTHRTGRRSLVLGASTDHVVGQDIDESRALLDDLLRRCTLPDRVYRHTWSVGDTVIWDNRGVIHRAAPYEPDSEREMLRTTVLGDEPIQ
ncbi:TauD/TfdA dioxygenase family protein [Rhodococcus sp. NPDC060086]|uniref:TauD/TfdA dioxygenase family protein n=1 Tax=Rhodococcus sp. NPDC060086 TaxID=3347055 RepID=UPI00365F6D3B